VPSVTPDSSDVAHVYRHRGPLLAIAVLVGSLVIFAALSIASWTMYDQSEQRLLEESTGQASQVLTVSVTGFKAPIEAAITVATISDGSPDAFHAAMADQVGPAPRPFTAAALFRVGESDPVATIGGPIHLPAEGPTSAAAIAATAASSDAPFLVIDLLSSGRRLGYAAVDEATTPEFMVYAERQLNPDPNVRARSDGPFARLDYAIYLNSEQPDKLISASVPDSELPIAGRRASASSAFGDQQLLLVTTPIGEFTSWLFANLWWIVALVGLIVSIGAAWLTRSLYNRREQALELAHDNARLYDEQRHIAETLQLSLLPQVLVPPPGGHVTARYWPAGEASLIGGDFYDAFRVDENRWAVVIGDVCGKGIDAAAITGLVRHTVRAAARNATSPADVLRDVHRALSDHQPSTFCTVCFFYVTVPPMVRNR